MLILWDFGRIGTILDLFGLDENEKFERKIVNELECLGLKLAYLNEKLLRLQKLDPSDYDQDTGDETIIDPTAYLKLVDKLILRYQASTSFSKRLSRL